MNDLEWLARNVHEWPKGLIEECACRFEIGSGGAAKAISTRRRPCGEDHDTEWFTHDQWLAERARLQNKPSWEDVPTQYSWYGQNASGKWDCFEYEPFANEHVNCWDYESGDALGLQNFGEVLGDWRDTLERRPESIEPEQPEWKQDELPPVGEECEVYRNGEWELCEIIAHIDQPMGTIAVFSYGREPGYGISGVDCLIPRYFRPVDVSRAEEERAVEEMIDIINMHYFNSDSSIPSDTLSIENWESYLKALYRAGLRFTIDNPNASN